MRTTHRFLSACLTFLLVLLFQSNMVAQNTDYIKEMENNDLQIRQMPGTEKLLSEYLKSAKIQEDTIYAILYIPAECYRCEAAIPAFYEKLKSNSANNKMLLISAYEDSVAAVRYNKTNNYKADYYLYDTKADYTKIFSFNSVSLYGLHVMKICPKSGVFITGGQYTLLGKEFINQLVACQKRLTPHLYPGTVQGEANRQEQPLAIPSKPVYPWTVEEFAVGLKNDVFISNVYDIPKFENGNFFFTDMLNNGVMLFSQEGRKLVYKTLFQANQEERKRFVSVSDSMFEKLVKQGQVFYIALSANMIDEHCLAISYSLPKIFGQMDGGEYNLSFYNAPAVLVRNIDNLQSEQMIAPDFDLMNADYFYMHFAFDLFNGRLWFGCQKLTWPMDGFEKDDIAGNVAVDPFNDKFYSTFNPIMASFDVKSGKCDGHYGKLEESQRLSKTGYYFLNNVYAHFGKDFLYGNGYTGKLYVSDSISVGIGDRCYDVFDIDLSKLPEPDSSKFYKLEYGSLYDANFSRCVTAVKMNDKEICCLVKYGRPRHDDFQNDRYSFVVIDRKSGKMKEFPLPSVSADEKCLGYGIRNEQDHFSPFVFLRSNSGYKLRNFINKNE